MLATISNKEEITIQNRCVECRPFYSIETAINICTTIYTVLDTYISIHVYVGTYVYVKNNAQMRNFQKQKRNEQRLVTFFTTFSHSIKI